MRIAQLFVAAAVVVFSTGMASGQVNWQLKQRLQWYTFDDLHFSNRARIQDFSYGADESAGDRSGGLIILGIGDNRVTELTSENLNLLNVTWDDDSVMFQSEWISDGWGAWTLHTEEYAADFSDPDADYFQGSTRSVVGGRSVLDFPFYIGGRTESEVLEYSFPGDWTDAASHDLIDLDPWLTVTRDFEYVDGWTIVRVEGTTGGPLGQRGTIRLWGAQVPASSSCALFGVAALAGARRRRRTTTNC